MNRWIRPKCQQKLDLASLGAQTANTFKIKYQSLWFCWVYVNFSGLVVNLCNLLPCHPPLTTNKNEHVFTLLKTVKIDTIYNKYNTLSLIGSKQLFFVCIYVYLFDSSVIMFLYFFLCTLLPFFMHFVTFLGFAIGNVCVKLTYFKCVPSVENTTQYF